MGSIILCVFLGVILVGALVCVSLYFTYNNREIALRKLCEAQRGTIRAVRDTMFKIIHEKAGVALNYRDAFAKIYPEIIAGRYSHDDGLLSQWIEEQNPEFDISLYASVQVAIESQRRAFQNAQMTMLDIINQRAAFIESYPARWLVNNQEPIEYRVIVAEGTDRVFDTGVDNWTLQM